MGIPAAQLIVFWGVSRIPELCPSEALRMLRSRWKSCNTRLNIYKYPMKSTCLSIVPARLHSIFWYQETFICFSGITMAMRERAYDSCVSWCCNHSVWYFPCWQECDIAMNKSHLSWFQFMLSFETFPSHPKPVMCLLFSASCYRDSEPHGSDKMRSSLIHEIWPKTSSVTQHLREDMHLHSMDNEKHQHPSSIFYSSLDHGCYGPLCFIGWVQSGLQLQS